jgi:hypothetical protein
MSFNLQTNAKELSFDYRAVPVKQQYSGIYSLNNFQTEATFFGKFLSFTPTCQEDALTAVESWFQQPLGVVTYFSCFGDLTNGRLIAGDYSWTAEVSFDFNLLLKSWKLVSGVWVRQPYVVTSARPITSNLTVVNNRFTAIPGSPITTLKFGFQITPELTSIKYTRNGGKVTFEDIPFLVVPRSAWL